MNNKTIYQMCRDLKLSAMLTQTPHQDSQASLELELGKVIQMKIYVNIKSLGKKKKALTPMEYEISENISTLKEFLIEMVKIEVEKYNEKGTEVQSIFVFSNKEIEELAEVGKVGFGRVYSDKKADLQQAIENVLQCYKDGLVRVFQNDMEYYLCQSLYKRKAHLLILSYHSLLYKSFLNIFLVFPLYLPHHLSFLLHTL